MYKKHHDLRETAWLKMHVFRRRQKVHLEFKPFFSKRLPCGAFAGIAVRLGSLLLPVHTAHGVFMSLYHVFVLCPLARTCTLKFASPLGRRVCEAHGVTGPPGFICSPLVFVFSFTSRGLQGMS